MSESYFTNNDSDGEGSPSDDIARHFDLPQGDRWISPPEGLSRIGDYFVLKINQRGTHLLVRAKEENFEIVTQIELPLAEYLKMQNIHFSDEKVALTISLLAPLSYHYLQHFIGDNLSMEEAIRKTMDDFNTNTHANNPDFLSEDIRLFRLKQIAIHYQKLRSFPSPAGSWTVVSQKERSQSFAHDAGITLLCRSTDGLFNLCEDRRGNFVIMDTNLNDLCDNSSVVLAFIEANLQLIADKIRNQFLACVLPNASKVDPDILEPSRFALLQLLVTSEAYGAELEEDTINTLGVSIEDFRELLRLRLWQFVSAAYGIEQYKMSSEQECDNTKECNIFYYNGKPWKFCPLKPVIIKGKSFTPVSFRIKAGLHYLLVGHDGQCFEYSIEAF